MTETIFVFILFFFIVLFVIFSRVRRIAENFRHNMDEKPILPPEPLPRRSLEETLQALTAPHEQPKPVVEENPAENLLQEVRERRAKDLAIRNQSLREIPEKRVIPQLGTPIVESPETKELKRQLAEERAKNAKQKKDMHFSAYRVRDDYHPSRYNRMFQNPDSARDAFIASEIFRTKF